jgi:hypothetical protein
MWLPTAGRYSDTGIPSIKLRINCPGNPIENKIRMYILLYHSPNTLFLHNPFAGFQKTINVLTNPLPWPSQNVGNAIN